MLDVLVKISSLVQAGCAVLGLVGLYLYVRETQIIRMHTQAQADATRRPVLMLTNLSFKNKRLQVTNVGIGPALNIEWFSSTRPVHTGSVVSLRKDAAS